MVATPVKKLIDEAIIPAVLLILAKMAGLLVASYLLHLKFEVKVGGFLNLLPSIKFFSVSDYILAENYSNLAMLIIVSLGTMFVLLRLHFLHDTHVHPNVQHKLASFNLEKIISSSYPLYHTAVTWLIFMWLTVAFLAASTFFKITYVPITVIALVIAINFTWLIAFDVQKELENA